MKGKIAGDEQQVRDVLNVHWQASAAGDNRSRA